MMDENRVAGAAQTVGGRVQEAVGEFTGDAATKLRGQVNQAAGTVKNAAGAAADEMRGFGDQLAGTVKDQPLTSLAVAGGVGLLMGYLLSR